MVLGAFIYTTWMLGTYVIFRIKTGCKVMGFSGELLYVSLVVRKSVFGVHPQNMSRCLKFRI